MPSIVDKITLPPELDRRVKLTKEDKQAIREEYATGTTSSLKLAKKWKVSKSLILIIVNPKIAEKRKQYVKEHWKELRASKDVRTAAVQNNRHYKMKLLKEGKIKDPRS